MPSLHRQFSLSALALAGRLLLVTLFIPLATSCKPGRKITDLDPAHPDLLQIIIESAAICPEGYELVQNPEVLRGMGMKQNPDFISNTSELEAMARFGGTNPFLAVYGINGSVRMMVNGVFFRDANRVDAFVRDQEKRKRLRIAVYEKPLEHGTWVLICAVDPKRTYPESERQAIQAALERKENNLETQLRFIRLWEDPS
ncbi:MAG TPA: hypothetical protein PKE55_01215 [Kiritimatiellia bacterium]|nr:hypothetical protein [Kiritimatiellia bacterium]